MRGPNDLSSKIPLFAELQKLMSWTGGPVNWDLARQIAISTVADEHREPTAAERDQVEEAVRLADLWLDACPPCLGHPDGRGLEPGRVDRTDLAVWKKLCDPVAARIVGAMGTSSPKNPIAARAHEAVMNQSAGSVRRPGRPGLGALADEVISAADIGLPLASTGTAALVPENINAFGEGLESRTTRSASTSRCVRPPTSGSSPTWAGCGRRCPTPSRPTRAASASIRAPWNGR